MRKIKKELILAIILCSIIFLIIYILHCLESEPTEFIYQLF